MPKAQIQERVRAARENARDRASAGSQAQGAFGRAAAAGGGGAGDRPRAGGISFDEPLSNLDAKLRVTTRAELKRLHRRLKTTTIYVTHDQEEAMTLGERIVVMKDGVIQQADTPLMTYNLSGESLCGGIHRDAADEFFRRGDLKRVDGELIFEEGIKPAAAG